ncbi:MAG: hypothetical protein NVS2B14_14400 [Chamaesiphon sp.]
MLKTISNVLEQLANGKAIAALVSIFLVLQIILILVPRGGPPLDFQFWYSPERAYEMLEEYGEKGRKLYALSVLTLDFVFPIIYSLFFAVILTLLLRYSVSDESFWKNVRFLPFAAMLSDWLENFGIFIMLTQPKRLETVAILSSIFTSIKWTLISTTIGAILLFAFVALLKVLLKN